MTLTRTVAGIAAALAAISFGDVAYATDDDPCLHQYVKETRERVGTAADWSAWTPWDGGTTLRWEAPGFTEEGHHGGDHLHPTAYDRDYRYVPTGQMENCDTTTTSTTEVSTTSTSTTAPSTSTTTIPSSTTVVVPTTLPPTSSSDATTTTVSPPSSSTTTPVPSSSAPLPPASSTTPEPTATTPGRTPPPTTTEPTPTLPATGLKADLALVAAMCVIVGVGCMWLVRRS